MRDPTEILEDILGFKGIQTSQVLEAQKELSKSVILNFIEPCGIS